MLSTGELGIALLGMAFGALAAMNLSGYLAARFGSRSVTVIASMSLCLMLLLLALAPTLPILVGTLVLFGASNGSMDVAMNAQGVAVERQYGRPILNSFHACYSLGGLVGALAGGLAASHSITPLPHFLGVALFCAILTLSVARPCCQPRQKPRKQQSRLPVPRSRLLARRLPQSPPADMLAF